MPDAASTFALQGRALFIAYRDLSGYPIGLKSDGTIPDPDAVELGEVYHGYRVSGYVERTAPTKDIEYATNQSDGTNKGKTPMGINDYGTGEITLSEEDETALNMIRKSRSDSTINTEWVVTSANDTEIESPAMVMMFVDRVRDEKGGGFWYKHTIYHNATITVSQPAGASQSGGTNPNNSTWSYEVAPSDRASVTGYAFSDTDLEVLEDNDTYSVIRAPRPLAFSTYIGDGTTGTWATEYRPLYSNVTGDVHNTISKNGVIYPVTSYSTTTALITPAASVTSGDFVMVLYETAYKRP